MSSPTPLTVHHTGSIPAPSPGTRLRLHPTSTTPGAASRSSIINSSAKGWSPLNINKRDGASSPMRSPQHTPDPTGAGAGLLVPDTASPRRSSSSFKHVSKNSLVSNSPFKSPTTVQGQQAAGLYEANMEREKAVIHERRAPARALGVSPEKATGVNPTPKAAIGLGIGIGRPVTQPRSASKSRTPSGSSSGSALNGTRRVSSERRQASMERHALGDRKTSGTKENDSPDARSSSAMKAPRSSVGLKGLERNAYVSKSPFLSVRRVPSGERRDSPSQHSPKSGGGLVEKDDVFGSPSPSPTSNRESMGRRRSSGGRSSSSPSKHLMPGSNASPTPSPPRGVQAISSSSTSGANGPSPLGFTSTTPSRSMSSSASTTQPLAPPIPHQLATPQRSSMTPSRRIRGPREASDGLVDSPSKQPKTVTFQAIPDVKEFEPASVEGSADGSFDVDSAVEHEGDSIDSGDLGAEISNLRITNPDTRTSRSPSPETVEESDMGHADPEESTTADFVNTLIEEGLFSPPQGQSPSFPDQPAFELPLALSADDKAPALSTPSLGGSVHATPILGGVSGVDRAAMPEVDEVGIPYGRTHHAERAAAARGNTAVQHAKSVPQPALPHQSDEKMLFNGNARYSDPWSAGPISPRPDQSTFSPQRQALPQVRSPPPATASAPHARQAGPMPDPFITLQTATKVLAPQTQAKAAEREEDGIPLGRSSHHERMMAARQLATQGLGLGMPRSPAVTGGLSTATSQMGLPTPREPVNVVPGASELDKKHAETARQPAVERKEALDEDQLFDVSFGSEHGEEVERVKKAEKADKRWSAPASGTRRPPVEALDLPSPVASPTKEKIEQNQTLRPQPTVKEQSRFSLPTIGFTSPFFSQSAKVATPLSPASESGSSAHSEELNTDSPPQSPVVSRPVAPIPAAITRPLTPPPKIQDGQAKVESPHRLPSFDFEDITLETVGRSEVHVARVVSPKKAPVAVGASTSSSTIGSPSSTSIPSQPQHVASPPALIASSSSTDFGGKGTGSDSTNTRVRARISRDAIRETVNQRLADGSISRRGSTPALNVGSGLRGKTSFYADLAPTPPRPVSIAFPPRHTDKSLPLPPSPSHLRVGSATQMDRAHTTDTNATGRKVSSQQWNDKSEGDSAYVGRRPTAHHRHSQSQSAHEALKASERDGLIGEPKSGLDRIIARGDGARLGDSTSSGSTAILKPAMVVGPPVPAKEGMSQGGSSTALLDSTTKGTTGKVKTAAQAREEAIIAKRREKEGRVASSGSTGSAGSRRSRRSMSMSDAKQFEEMRKAGGRKPRLTLGIKDDDVSILDAFNEDSAHIGNRAYKVKERGAVVKASYGPVGHGRAGDVHAGKAWRQLRRASDMNEHNKQLKELRAREAETGKASGTIFVKVLGIEQLAVPIPDQPTYFCITLDNGIDYIRTPYSVLIDGAKVNQEFSLVEHAGFEFSLSLDVRSDPHILKAIHEKRNPNGSSAATSGSGRHASSTSHSPALAPPMLAKTSSGFKGFFGVSPRKKRPESMFSRSGTPVLPLQTRPAQPSIADFFANEVINSGAGAGGKDGNGSGAGKAKSFPIAKTHVAFKPIAKQCEAKVLEIRYPMFSMVRDAGVSPTTPTATTDAASLTGAAATANGRKQVAKITLQILRLPPLAGLRPEEMPGCIDDALRGIRHHGWWRCEYHEGVLTQFGGDCALRPKRRMYKLIGGNLVAINEVTKKEVTTIDLRKVVGVVDLNADDAPIASGLGGSKRAGSPVSRLTMRLRDDDETVRPRSFRLEFGEDESDGIDFWADRDEDKEMWLNTLRGLIGKIPSNPLWAEMLARKQQEAKERAAIKKMGSSTSLKKRAERERHRESVAGGMSAQAGTRADAPSGAAEVMSPRKK